MVLGPGKLFGAFFAFAALLVAFTIAVKVPISMRMQRSNGTLAIESNGGKAISYSIGRIGTSSANSVNVHVKYRYTVNGKEYVGTTLGLNGNSYGFYSEDKVKIIIAELTSSAEIPVWYDPKHPEYSVIIKPKFGKEWVWLLSLILLALLSFKYLDMAVVKLSAKNQ
jgi:hypothetical protein